MGKVFLLVGFGLLQYGLGWIAGRLYKRPQPILYETDGTFLNAVYKNGAVENLPSKSKQNLSEEDDE
jgi:hypothetical protein